MKDDLRLLAGDHRIDPAALANIGEQRMDPSSGQRSRNSPSIA